MSTPVFKSPRNGRYLVYLGEAFIGYVTKVEGWSARGKPVHWVAKTRGGRVIGSNYRSRSEAGTALQNRNS